MKKRTASIMPRRMARERGMMEKRTKPLQSRFSPPNPNFSFIVDEILVFPSPIGYMLST